MAPAGLCSHSHLIDVKHLQVISFNNIVAITNNVIPILLSFYLGSWSDQFGRLPFLAIYMVGRTLSALANLLNSIYLEEWGKWVWLATVMPPLNLSGGISSYIIMCKYFFPDAAYNFPDMIIGL